MKTRIKWLQYWGNNGVVTYVETQPNANVDQINKKLYSYIQNQSKKKQCKNVYLSDEPVENV